MKAIKVNSLESLKLRGFETMRCPWCHRLIMIFGYGKTPETEIYVQCPKCRRHFRCVI